MPDDEYVSGKQKADSPKLPLGETFDKYFPFYLSIGMSADEFWNQDCELVKYYRQAHELKKKRKNEEFWLQGLYFYDAITKSIDRVLAPKGTTVEGYSKEPYPLTTKEIEERAKREERMNYKNMKERMLEFLKKQQ